MSLTDMLFKNTKGFSLPIVLVTLGILVILGLAMATFSSDAMKFLADLDQLSRVNDSTEETRLVLLTEDQCTQNFKGQSFDPTGASPSVEIPVISQYAPPPNLPSIVIMTDTSGEFSRGLRVSKINLTAENAMDGNLTAGNLTLTFERSFQGQVRTVLRTLPLFAKTKAGLIQECWLNRSQSSTTYEKICLAVSGGQSTTYNAATGQCVVPTTKWVAGGPREAKCTSPETPLPGASATDSCRVNTHGWVDPTAQTFVMADGSVRQRSKFANHNTMTADGCKCAYATDISETDISTFTCEIRCVSQ